MVDLPEPHSSEWFQKMLLINPDQARHTERIVELAGTRNCCGVCGETENVRDYKTVSEPIIAVRLCDDCVKIQKNQHGLSLDPL